MVNWQRMGAGAIMMRLEWGACTPYARRPESYRTERLRYMQYRQVWTASRDDMHKYTDPPEKLYHVCHATVSLPEACRPSFKTPNAIGKISPFIVELGLTGTWLFLKCQQ